MEGWGGGGGNLSFFKAMLEFMNNICGLGTEQE
jgi:hypothetical protein